MIINIFTTDEVREKLATCIDNVADWVLPDDKVEYYPLYSELSDNLVAISEQNTKQYLYFILDIRQPVPIPKIAAISELLQNSPCPGEIFIILDETRENMTAKYKLFVKEALGKINCKIKYLMSNTASDGAKIEFDELIETIGQYILAKHQYKVFEPSSFVNNASILRNTDNFFIVLGRKEFTVSVERIKKIIIRELLTTDIHSNGFEENIEKTIDEHLGGSSNIDELRKNLNSLCVNQNEQEKHANESALKRIFGPSATGGENAIDDYFAYNFKIKRKKLDISDRAMDKDFRTVKKLLNDISAKLEHLKISAGKSYNAMIGNEESGVFAFVKDKTDFGWKRSTLEAAGNYLANIYTKRIAKDRKELIQQIEDDIKRISNEHIQIQDNIDKKVRELTMQLRKAPYRLLDENCEKYADNAVQYVKNHEGRYLDIFSEHNFDSIYAKCEAFSEAIIADCVNKKIMDDIELRIKDTSDKEQMFRELQDKDYFYANFRRGEFKCSPIFITGDWEGLPASQVFAKISVNDDRFWLLFIGAPVFLTDIANNRYGFEQ